MRHARPPRDRTLTSIVESHHPSRLDVDLPLQLVQLVLRSPLRGLALHRVLGVFLALLVLRDRLLQLFDARLLLPDELPQRHATVIAGHHPELLLLVLDQLLGLRRQLEQRDLVDVQAGHALEDRVLVLDPGLADPQEHRGHVPAVVQLVGELLDQLLDPRLLHLALVKPVVFTEKVKSKYCNYFPLDSHK